MKLFSNLFHQGNTNYPLQKISWYFIKLFFNTTYFVNETKCTQGHQSLSISMLHIYYLTLVSDLGFIKQ